MDVIVKRPMRDLNLEKQIENAIAGNEANAAKVDFVAMMVDVDLPVEATKEAENGTQSDVL